MEEILFGLLYIATIIVSAAIIPFSLRFYTKFPDEIYRKLLHIVALVALLVWTLVYDVWYYSVFTSIGAALFFYVILILIENINFFSKFMIERKKGEFISSLFIMFLMYISVTTICWGILDDRLLGICSIYAWGPGDAFAAIIGKSYGKHYLVGKHIEGTKSVEGTVSMFVVSFISILIVLLARGDMKWYAYLVIATVTAIVSTIAELFSLKGMDTIICPTASMITIIILVYLFGGLA